MWGSCQTRLVVRGGGTRASRGARAALVELVALEHQWRGGQCLAGDDARRGAGDPAGALAEAEASKGEHRAARFAALAMGTAHRFERVDVEAAESGEEIV